MSLFVGRLAREVRERDLEDVFSKFGRITRCVVKREGYAFVEFEDQRDADDALRQCDGMRILGERISVEYAKGTRRDTGAPSGVSNDECFHCRRPGHFARECPDRAPIPRRSGGASGPRYEGDRYEPRGLSRRDDHRRREYSRSPIR